MDRPPAFSLFVHVERPGRARGGARSSRRRSRCQGRWPRATESTVVLAGIALAVSAGATKFSEGANKGLEGLGKQGEKLGGNDG